jgi:hypothetical protein
LLTICGIRATSEKPSTARCESSAAGLAEESVKIRRLLVATVILLPGYTNMWLAAQQAKPHSKEPPARAVAAPARIWRSVTTGREYRVWMDKDRLHTEWVNLSPALAQAGAYIRSESHRVGTRWIGTVQSYLPCEARESDKRVSNRCHLETRIEIDSMTTERITGRAQALRRFDCKACRVIEAAWANFVWTPKDRKAEDGRQ